jgi:hypothetical protein
MHKRWHQAWRLFWLAWLGLALPMQGFAATTKMLCPQHQAGQGHERAHAFGQALGSAGLHAQHMGFHASHADPAPADHSGSHHSAKASQCSACGTCCAALGMPEQVLLAFQPPLVDSAQPAAAASPPLSFLTDGPERPPKVALA